jgi:type IV pilus assembly protein PilC
MLFSTQLSAASLAGLCHVLRHTLDAGITLRDAFRQQATRGDPTVRPAAERIRRHLEHGDSLETALAGEKESFPPLFIAMAQVGEQTGRLPEVFAELEKYYQLQEKLRRTFRQRSFPVFIQLGVAFLVIAVMLFALSFIADTRGGQAPAILGVRGAGGAVLFLVLSFGSVALVWLLYRVLHGTLRYQASVDVFLLRVPGLGGCLQALALGRFALALRLTLDSDLPVAKALRLSLLATGNAAFIARSEGVLRAVKEGEDLTLALSGAGLFPEEFIHMVAVAEESGRIPEVMGHQAEKYHDEAGRRLTALMKGLTWAVWLVYAIFTIIAIFKIAGTYFDQLN